MPRQLKMGLNVLVVFLLTIVILIFAFLTIGHDLYSLENTAQGPNDKTSLPFTEAELEALGLDVADIEALNSLPFDLQVVQSGSATQVNSSDTITFFITLTNEGDNPASFVFFESDPPSQFRGPDPLFNTTAISNGLTDPTWLLPTPVSPTSTVLITLTGILTSGPDAIVAHTVRVDAFDATGETDVSNNSDTITASIIGSNPTPVTRTAYLPHVLYEPTPTPTPTPMRTLAYYEPFSDDDDGWIEFDDFNDCNSERRDGQYWVDLERTDKECLPVANNDARKPERPFRTYGEFEVTGYHSEDLNDGDDDELSDAQYGIFINGQGGATQYIFRIAPNNGCTTGGSWQLIRNKDNDPNDDDEDKTTTVLAQGSCNTAINRDGNQNRLTIIHEEDTRRIAVLVNGEPLGEHFESSSSELRGEAVGVYVLSGDSDVRIKFDNYRVYKFGN